MDDLPHDPWPLDFASSDYHLFTLQHFKRENCLLIVKKQIWTLIATLYQKLGNFKSNNQSFTNNFAIDK